jgi:hypothetical protein
MWYTEDQATFVLLGLYRPARFGTGESAVWPCGRVDGRAQRDSWNRIWTFLEWHLAPYSPLSLGTTDR